MPRGPTICAKCVCAGFIPDSSLFQLGSKRTAPRTNSYIYRGGRSMLIPRNRYPRTRHVKFQTSTLVSQSAPRMTSGDRRARGCNMAAHCLVRVFANQHATCEIHIEEKQLDIPEPKSINLKVADCRSSILSWVEAWPAVGGGPTIITLSGLISYSDVIRIIIQ